MAIATEFHKFPPIEGVRWFNVAVLVGTPLIAVCGLFFIPFDWRTGLFAFAYYLFSMFGGTFIVVVSPTTDFSQVSQQVKFLVISLS